MFCCILGIKLRKGVERRHKEEQKKMPSAGIDVQSIMEAAFEMRRKALEANDDSEDDEDGGEEDWSDGDWDHIYILCSDWESHGRNY